MILTTDEVARSLAGAWDLSQRRIQGLRRFDCSPAGVWRSFAAFLLLAPAFVISLAAERASLGLLVPGAGLFDDAGIVATVLGRMAICFAMLPVTGWIFAGILGLRARFPGFLVASNWSNVLCGALLSIPGLLFALGLATAELSAVYTAAFLVIVAHLRWFVAKTALGVSGGLAALIVVLDLAGELLLSQVL